ncbi:Ubiquitin conjugation factor e4, partial [Globisporangium splendens]
MFACKREEAARARRQCTSNEGSSGGEVVDVSPYVLRDDEKDDKEERGECGSTSGDDDDRAFAPYMMRLRGMQQLVVELLDVHALSSAIEYRTGEPLFVNAREWWEDVQRKSIAASQRRKRLARHGTSGGAGDATTVAFARSASGRERIGDLVGDAHDVVSIQDVCTEALFKILQSLDRVNRRKSCASTLSLASRNKADSVETICTNVDDAIAFAAGQLLESWDAITMEEDSYAAATDFSIVVINMILQFCKIGSLHAFHPHVLVASSVRRVFGRATNWKCSVCTRYSEVKGPAAAPIVYRCAACDFNLCRECFTRIPNQSQQSEHPAIYLQEHLHVDRFFSLAFRELHEKDRFNVIAGKLGLELRRRVKDLPVYKSVEIASGAQLLVEMLASPSFALQIVEYTECDWFPVYMNTWMMGFLSFLGPFVRGTCISDEARVIDAMSEGQSTSTLAVGSEWQDGYRSLKTNFMAIMHALLSKTQHPYVVQATLAWLGCTVLSTNKRRRMNHKTNDMLDGFLINISTILVQLSLPVLEEEEEHPGYIDSAYHQGCLSMRAFGDKDVREAPLRDLAGIRGEQYVMDKMKAEEDRLREHDRQCIQSYTARASGDDAAHQYYPIRESHYGVACNQCYKQNFQGVRYKCAFCDDIDICGSCFEQFSRQSASAKGHIDEVLTTVLDGLQVHMLDHVFIRVGLPVPLYETRHFEMIRFEKAQFRRENNIFVDDALDPSLVCADCGCSLKDMEVSFKCSNCFDPRFVCADCVTREESSKNPFKMHAPGHLYFAITSSWRYTYSPTTPALHFRNLSHPSALLPREASTKETEFFYLAIKSLHFGPLLTLSRLISTLKEIQELQAFCFCEEEKVKHEARQRAAAERSSARRSSSRRPVKMSSHYTASKNRLGDLSEMRGMIELHLLEVSNVAEWLVFYARTCRWLLKLASPTQDANEEVLTDLSDAFIQFPEHFFSDLCDVIVLLGLDRLEYHDVMSEIVKAVKVENGDEDGIGSAVIEPLLVMLTQFVTSRELTRNPHLRVQALKALMALLSFFSKSKQNHSVTTIFEQNGFLQGFLVRGMLQFHEDMEKYHLRNNGLVFNSNVGSGDHLLWGFLPTRISVTLLLRYLWQIPSQRKVITNLFQLGSVPSDLSSEAAQNQLSVLVSGLWSDVAKLLDEGNSKIDTLVQLREIQESAMDGGNTVSLPFRPAMVDGYIALHSKQLRLTFRMMIEALELLSWMGDTVPLKKIMLKPELSEQCARIVSFLMSSLGTANESKSWNFSIQLMRDGKFLLANLVVLVVRCAGLSEKCSPSSFWKLIQESGGAMANCLGDLDTHGRWALNAITTRLESARYLCEIVDEDESADEMNSNNVVDNEEDMDEDEALALLEKQAADAVVATRSASSISSSRSSQALSIARHLGKRFVSSLSKDGRFDFTRFVKSLDMLRRENCVEEYELVDSSWVYMFVDAMNKCRDMIQLHASMDELMGDIPEEYLDPLLSTIMTDPVRLPSGQVVDRSVIERHLLSSQQVDPFTREPLTVEMLVPCDALRREIRLYLKSKIKHFKNEKEDVLATWGLAWNYMFDGGDWEESTTAQD